MKKKRCTIVVWSGQPSGNTSIPAKPRRTPRLTEEKQQKQSREEMVRSLQGIFCYGRYRSWAALRGRKRA